MNVSYDLNEKDQDSYLNLYWPNITSKNRRSRIWNNISIIFLICYSIFGFIEYFGNPKPIHLYAGIFGLVMAGVISFTDQLMRYFMLQQNRSLRQSPRFQRLLGRHTTSIETNGLRMTGQNGERLLLWSDLTHTETDTLDVFHLELSDAIVIPRRAFTSDAHRQSFLNAVEAAKTGKVAPSPQPQIWWTQTGVTEAETQNNQRGG